MAWAKVIAHADLDAFYASAEQLDNPELRGKPLLVGSTKGRGVVLTASYEARPYGVGSAMPMAQALRKCPGVLVVPPRFERYQELSAKVMATFYDFSPRVEAISLDEAFLDMTGTEHIFGPPQQMAERLRQAVFEATGGLTISVGVSNTKYVAKVGSGFQKPNGITVVPPDQAQAWLAKQSVSRLWGAGPKTQSRLQAAGYFTIGDIAAAPLAELLEQFGSMGERFYALAHAQDPRHVKGRGEARGEQDQTGERSGSMSSERTLTRDVVRRKDIEGHLTRAADRLARRLRSKSWLAGGVRVKLKTADFRSLTRQCSCTPTDSAHDLLQAALQLLAGFDDPGPFRLVGLAAHSLQTEESRAQLDMFAASGPSRRLEAVLDQVSEKFGTGAMQRARDLSANTLVKEPPNLDFMEDLLIENSGDEER